MQSLQKNSSLRPVLKKKITLQSTLHELQHKNKTKLFADVSSSDPTLQSVHKNSSLRSVLNKKNTLQSAPHIKLQQKNETQFVAGVKSINRALQSVHKTVSMRPVPSTYISLRSTPRELQQQKISKQTTKNSTLPTMDSQLSMETEEQDTQKNTSQSEYTVAYNFTMAKCVSC